jgi:uncharacterized protein involved in cysteine biosynthesis
MISRLNITNYPNTRSIPWYSINTNNYFIGTGSIPLLFFFFFFFAVRNILDAYFNRTVPEQIESNQMVQISILYLHFVPMN